MTASATSTRAGAAVAGSGGLRRDIQGLRAVAVLAVIANHLGLPYSDGGYVGVDVFFVLSGFLITSLLVREADHTGRISLVTFYARRARRILPASTLVLVAIVATATVELSYAGTQRVTTDALWAAFFLANVHFARLGTDYFAEGLPPSPVQHYWSLAVEEQFYLVWPTLLALLLLGVRRRARRSDAGHAGQRDPWPLVASVAGVLCLAALAWSVFRTHTAPTDAYFSSLTRAWELGTGMLLALVASRLGRLPAPVRHGLTVGGLVAIGLAVVLLDARTPFPGYVALLPVLGTAAVVGAGIGGDGVGLGRLLTLRPMTWVGDLSYSLYLWHWPVLVLWAERTGPDRGPLETAGLLGVVLALSVGSYYLVENPVRRGRFMRPRLRSLMLWPVSLALVVGAVGLGTAAAGQRLEERLSHGDQYAGLRSDRVPVHAELVRSVAPAASDDPVAFPLDSLDQLDALKTDLWNYRYRCSAGHASSDVRICPVGDVDADRTMVVLGDSHMGQWLPAFDTIGAEHGYRVIPLIKFGCPVYDVELLTDGLKRVYTECSDFQRWAVDEIGRLQPDVVYAGARGLPRNMSGPAEQRPQAWADGVRTFIDQVGPLTPDLRLLSDVSLLTFDPIECLTDVRSTMGICSSPESSRVLLANDIVREAAKDMGVPYVDVTSLACVRGRCPAFAGSRMVFANLDHLSMDWVEHVTPEFAERIGVPRRSSGRFAE